MARARSAARTTFMSLRTRNYRLFFFCQLISQIGNWLTMVALTLLVLHATKSGVAVGALVACQYGPILLIGAYGGLIADRSDKRLLLIITQTLQMAQSFTLAALAFMHHPPLIAFYVTALAGGLILSFDNPARRSFVSEMVPPEQLHNAVTLNTAQMTSARVVGPALAGVLVMTAGYAWTFAIDALSYIVVIGGYVLMRKRELFQVPKSARAKGQVREGLRYVRTVRELYVPMVMVAIIGIFAFNFTVTLPLFVVRSLHGSDGTYTVVYAVLSVGSLAAALKAAHRPSHEVPQLVRGAFLFGAAMLLFALTPSLLGVFPVALFVGFASITFMTGATAIMQVRSDPSMRGRVLALQSIVLVGSSPIGGPLLGWACDQFGARAGVAIGGVGAISAGLWGRAECRRPLHADDPAGLRSEVATANA
ncbi:MAG: MFS transporter [Actinomycetota bacterium]